MGAYIVRRCMLGVPTILLISVAAFASIRFIPGSVLDVLASEGGGLGGDTTDLKERLGINDPVYVQYWSWISGLVRGDGGRSLLTGDPVFSVIGQRILVTLEVSLLAISVAIVMGVVIGIVSAVKQDSIWDYLGRSMSIGLVAIPNFWMATLVLVLPAYYWNVVPSGRWVGITEDPLGNIRAALVPAIVLGVHLSGSTMRMTRTMMLEVLRQDYVRTARAKGLASRTVVGRHAFRNAIVPVVTIVGLQVPVLIGGSAITEKVFGVPGMGQLAVDSLLNRDYTVVAAVNLVFALFVVGVNIGVDVLYGVLDPRIRYSS